MYPALVVCLLAVGWAALATAVELTFEMKTEKVSCFHEHINKSSKYTFEYQVDTATKVVRRASVLIRCGRTIVFLK